MKKIVPRTPDEARDDITLIQRTRESAKSIEDLLGHSVPDATRRRCLMALVRECQRTGQKQLGFENARAVIAASLRAEFSIGEHDEDGDLTGPEAA